MDDKIYRVVDGRPLPDFNSENVIQNGDGDKLDIDFSPTSYIPDASIPEADDVDDLSAHLKGIDDAIGASSKIKAVLYNADTVNKSVGVGTVITTFDVPINSVTDKVLFFISFYCEHQLFSGDYEINFERVTAPSGTIKTFRNSTENRLYNWATAAVDSPGSIETHTYRLYCVTAAYNFTCHIRPSIIVAIVFDGS